MTFDTLRHNLSLPEAQVQEAMEAFQNQKPDGTPVQFLRYLQKGGLIEIEEVLRLLTSSKVDVSTSVHSAERQNSEDDVVENFELEGELGAGAMGEVHIARDLILNRKVAVKWIKEEAIEKNAKQRFVREILINAQLDHPNIIPVYSMEETREGDLAYTMKLVRGQTLGEIIDSCAVSFTDGQEEPIPLEGRLELFLKVCDAMYYAHIRGVIHRDLKPANIMIGPFGEVFVMDWGIARLIEGEEAEAFPTGEGEVVLRGDGDTTQDGAVIGTIAHISPEQARGEINELDGRSDQYVLGLILFELVTLRRAIPKGKIRDMLRRAQRGMMAPTAHISPRVKIRPELQAIIQKATRNRISERYRSVAEFAEDIRRYLRDEPVLAKPDTLLQKSLRWMSSHRSQALFAFMMVILIGLMTNIYNLNVQQVQRQKAEAQQAEIQRQLAFEEGLRRQFVEEVSATAYRVEDQFTRVKGILRGIAEAASIQLMNGNVQSSRSIVDGVYLSSDYDDPKGRPIDFKQSKRYGRMVSTNHAVFKLAPDLDVANHTSEINRLSALQESLRNVLLRSQSDRTTLLSSAEEDDALLNSGTPIVWAFVATESGIHMAFPGKGGYDSDYDPRLRPWYTMAKSSPSPHCDRPYEDSMGQGFLLPCSMPIMAETDLIGVAGIDLSLEFVAKAISSVGDYAIKSSTLIDSDGHFVLRGGENWKFDREEGRADTDLLVAIAEQSNGVLIRTDGDDPEVIVFRSLDTLNWTYVVRMDMSTLLSGTTNSQ